MPYLNWKEREIRQSVDAAGVADSRSTFNLVLGETERTQLVSFLEEVFLRGGSELRVDLPENWIVFWKSRESESRLLLAHPQRGEFVTTLALEAEHGKRVIDELKKLGAGDAFLVSEQGIVGSVSNVEVVVSLK
jgi:hypothetical protein